MLTLPDIAVEIKNQVKKLKISLNEDKLIKLENYIKLLEKWNKSYNLSAIRDVNEMLDKHLIDSLSIAKYIQGDFFLDVGTGAGLPGIPLAIHYPEKKFCLLDSNGKKTRFLQQVKIELGLSNIEIFNQRIEQHQSNKHYDGILSRAFASLEDMLNGAEHICADNGHYYAMKGQYPEMELQHLSKPYKVQSIHWADDQPERHLVIISQK